MTEHRQFFGDQERTFRFSATEIVELERLSGMGIGRLCTTMFAGQFSFTDLRNVVRLSLVGGGTVPEEAEALCKAYVDGRPLNETYPLAVSVLEALWFGTTSSGSNFTEAPDVGIGAVNGGDDADEK